MKIIHVAPPFLELNKDMIYGGIERVINDLRAKQQERGLQTKVLAPRNSNVQGIIETGNAVGTDEIFAQNINQNDARASTYSKLEHIYKIIEYAKINPKTIFHIHDDYLLPFMPLMNHALLTIHCDYEEFWSAENHREIAKTSRNLIAISKSQKSIFNSHGFKIDKVVYNGIDTSAFRFNDYHNNYMFSLSVIAPHKGQHIAIEVAKKLKKELVIAGNIGDQDYFDSFRNEINFDLSEEKDKYGALMKLPKGFKIVYTGSVNDSQKKPLFEHAEVFLMPYMINEPFGLVVVEALASGTPVVALNKGAAQELIKEGSTGFVRSNSYEMAVAIKDIKRIERKECRRDCEERFSLDKMAQDYMEIYKEIEKEK